MSWHVFDESLHWVGKVWVLNKEFADDIEVLGKANKNWQKIKLYVLLYAKYAHMYDCITTHVCYL